MRKLLLITTAFTFMYAKAVSQAPATVPDSILVQAGNYQESINPESTLYHGAEHMDFHPLTIGIPYFESIDWLYGTIYTGDLVFKKVPMKYDLVKDRLVIRHYNGFYKIELVSQRIDSFHLAGHSFLRLQSNKQALIPETGFYEVIYTPHLNVIIRRENRMVEFIENSALARRVESSFQFWADKDGKRYAIHKLKDLLNLMPEHKKDVQRQLKKSGIRYRTNKVLAITTAVSHYNQLNNAN